jgi:hypothetical protein
MSTAQTTSAATSRTIPNQDDGSTAFRLSTRPPSAARISVRGGEGDGGAASVERATSDASEDSSPSADAVGSPSEAESADEEKMLGVEGSLRSSTGSFGCGLFWCRTTTHNAPLPLGQALSTNPRQDVRTTARWRPRPHPPGLEQRGRRIGPASDLRQRREAHRDPRYRSDRWRPGERVLTQLTVHTQQLGTSARVTRHRRCPPRRDAPVRECYAKGLREDAGSGRQPSPSSCPVLAQLDGGRGWHTELVAGRPWLLGGSARHCAGSPDRSVRRGLPPPAGDAPRTPPHSARQR